MTPSDHNYSEAEFERAVGRGLREGAFLWEAINSTALSHDTGCTCRVCRAAGGDVGALLALEMALEEQRRAQ